MDPVTLTIDLKPLESLSEDFKKRYLPAVLEASAAGVRNALLEHFRARQMEPNKNGFTPRGFWSGTNGDSVAERVREPVIEQEKSQAHVRIDSPALHHKLNPNPPPIRPKHPTKTGKGSPMLALPATDAAYRFPGLPRDFPGVKFGYALHPQGGRRPALLSAGAVAYWLVRQVRTRHDPRSLPEESFINSFVQSAIHSVFPPSVPN